MIIFTENNVEKTSTPIKIKTIKKHSKIPLEIKKQQQQRPKVDNIEWNQTGIDEIDENLIREISTVNMEDITEPDNQQFQAVTLITQLDEETSYNTKSDDLTENRVNSESDESLVDLQNKNIKISKTVGSSSGSDVALHEPGAELSDDETGD